MEGENTTHIGTPSTNNLITGRSGTRKPLKALYTNADQLLNKMEDLKMDITSREPDIIVITEVIPKAQEQPITRARLKLNGYHEIVNFDPDSFNLGRSGKRGIIIFTKENLKAHEFMLLSSWEEHLWVKVNLIHGDWILVGGIYRSPSRRLEECIDGLRDVFGKALVSGASHIIICGDFNAKGINLEHETTIHQEGHASDQFLQLTQNHFLFQHVMQPTRYRQGERTEILDLIFSNEEGMVTNLNYFPGIGLSDHICIQFTIQCYNEERQAVTPKPDYNRADFPGIMTILDRLNWRDMLEDVDVHEAWQSFNNKLQCVLKEHVPERRTPRLRRNMYMTTPALRMRRRKEKQWKRYLLTGQAHHYVLYSRTRNALRRMTRKLKREFENNLVSKIKENPKSFWSYVKTKTKTRVTVEALKRNDGSLAESSREKAEVLNEFFASVFTKENLTNIPHMIPVYDGPALEDVEITPGMVESKLKELNPSKSPGPDQVHPRVLKELASTVCGPLSHIFRKSLDSGRLPKPWKEANVSPIFKKGSRREPGNYRPISLTSIAGKIMESFIRDVVLSHLLENNLLTDAQFGFLPKRSCDAQLLSCMEEWTHMLELGHPIDIVYLDFKKAFDSVPHVRLLNKLQAYGVGGKLLAWISDFLQGRRQRVNVDGELSSWRQVESGIPQGSVLGPLCFLVYVNDIPREINSPMKMFADDTKIYGEVSTTDKVMTLQKDLDAVARWTSVWQLPLNTAKCQSLHLGGRNTGHQYHIGDVLIEGVKEERDLGVIIDDKLTFHCHTGLVMKKANAVLAVIKKSFDCLDMKTLPILYKTLVRPIIEYANTVWGPIYIGDQKKIERIQRRATKLLPELSQLPYQERLKKLNLPSLMYRRKRGEMLMVYRIMTGLTETSPIIFQRSTTGQRTRGHHLKLQKPRAVRVVRRHHLGVRAVNEWNGLPQEVVSSPSLNTFKSRLDAHWKNKMFNLEW